jgi:GTP-binding protein EngB required for normal cell division
MMPENPRGYGRIGVMPIASRPLRLLIVALLALVAAGLLWVVFGVVRSGVALWNELRDFPSWLQIVVAAIVVIVIIAAIVFARRTLRPGRRKKIPVAAPTRAEVDLRLIALRDRNAETAALQSELEDLDRRARSEELYVAVFGEISAGKSSLVRALTNDADAQIDVIGGTTRAVAHYRGTLDDAPLTLADVPGSHEVGGAAREQLARDEALRAHVVLYVCAGDLTRDQDAELRWLRGFGKPLVLALNKVDQFSDADRAALENALKSRYASSSDAQVVVSAGGTERFERRLPDGRRESVERERVPDVTALRKVLESFAVAGSRSLEPAREAAVLTAVNQRADKLESISQEREAEAIVAKYTKRAVVGALAAVVPGSDLVIQGVLATALIRELAKLYDVAVRDVDIDAFLGQVKLTVRTSASLVLAIAGNALKAFPGLGTLGGGVLHAIAYGLIFDSLGRAVAKTFREQRALDSSSAQTALADFLANASAERVRQIARYVLDRDK